VTVGAIEEVFDRLERLCQALHGLLVGGLRLCQALQNIFVLVLSMDQESHNIFVLVLPLCEPHGDLPQIDLEAMLLLHESLHPDHLCLVLKTAVLMAVEHLPVPAQRGIMQELRPFEDGYTIHRVRGVHPYSAFLM
jgi:hypothetical protein